jgi:hypothetical protein
VLVLVGHRKRMMTLVTRLCIRLEDALGARHATVNQNFMILSKSSLKPGSSSKVCKSKNSETCVVSSLEVEIGNCSYFYFMTRLKDDA